MPSTPPPIQPGHLRPWSIAAAVAVVTVGSVGTLVLGGPGAPDITPKPTIVVGDPVGVAIVQATAAPALAATPPMTEVPTTEAPTTRASPAPSPTPAPVAASDPTAEPPPATTPPPTQAPTPEPTRAPTPQPTAVVAATAPDDTVAAFYGHVVNGNFDAAYALWSDRMKATYPRQENLDGRFANTASIVFSELYVASQSATAATVQANFTETYDSGSSRQFIGYWRLILIDGAWILDEPTY